MFGKGGLIWGKKNTLHLKNQICFFFCPCLGYLEISQQQLPNFSHIPPHLPDQLTLLQTSDTVDSAHIPTSIHPNLHLQQCCDSCSLCQDQPAGESRGIR